jgi:hypothetical protein
LAFAQPATNEVLQWNEITMKAIDANGQSNVVATRTLAMTQGAVHDALNAINRRYDAYYFEGSADAGASPDAAVAAAAHTVLVGVVSSFGTPAQKGAALALVEQAYSASLARVTDGPARNKGVAVGRAAGTAMLALRKDDGATRDAAYTPGMGAGKWRPHPNPAAESAYRESGCRSRIRAFVGSQLGQRHPVHLALLLAVLAPRTPGFDEPDLRAGFQ